MMRKTSCRSSAQRSKPAPIHRPPASASSAVSDGTAFFRCAGGSYRRRQEPGSPLRPPRSGAFMEHLAELACRHRQQSPAVPVEHDGVAPDHIELVDLAGAIVRRHLFRIGGEPAAALSADFFARGSGRRLIDLKGANFRMERLDYDT